MRNFGISLVVIAFFGMLAASPNALTSTADLMRAPANVAEIVIRDLKPCPPALHAYCADKN